MKGLRKMWQELETVLRDLVQAYKNMTALGKKKKELLIAVDMKSLDQLLKVEEKLVQSIDRLEKQRGRVLMGMATKYPSLNASSGMQQVIAACPAERRGGLKALHRELGDAVAAAQELSANNEVLIVHALNAVNFHLNRIGGAAVEPAYGQKGQEVVTRPKNFDFRA